MGGLGEAGVQGWWVCMNQAGLDKHGLAQMGAGLGISSKTVLQLQTGPVRTLPQGSLPSQCGAASGSQVSEAGPSSRCTRGEGRWCQVGLGWKEGCETSVGTSLPARWLTDRINCSRREKAGHRCCSWGGRAGPGRTAAHRGWSVLEAAGDKANLIAALAWDLPQHPNRVPRPSREVGCPPASLQHRPAPETLSLLLTGPLPAKDCSATRNHSG